MRVHHSCTSVRLILPLYCHVRHSSGTVLQIRHIMFTWSLTNAIISNVWLAGSRLVAWVEQLVRLTPWEKLTCIFNLGLL